MPEILDHAPPDFGRFRNLLKIMANLNPVLYPEPRKGTIRLALKRSMDGQSWECTYAVNALFSDRGDDPSIDLRVELESKKPWEDGVNPELDYLT